SKRIGRGLKKLTSPYLFYLLRLFSHLFQICVNFGSISAYFTISCFVFGQFVLSSFENRLGLTLRYYSHPIRITDNNLTVLNSYSTTRDGCIHISRTIFTSRSNCRSFCEYWEI